MLVDARRRVQFIKKLFDVKSGFFLDIGCTDGRLELKLNKDKFFGIDTNEEALRIAKTRSFPVVLADARYLPFKEKSFDGRICSEVLEHIEEDRLAIAEISRVLKRNAIAVVSVSNRDFKRIFPFKRLVENLYLRLEEFTLHVRRGYTVEELKALFKRESLKLERVEYDLKAVGAFFHLLLYHCYRHQQTKFRRFILRVYIRLLKILAFLYPLDNILQREGFQIFAKFRKL